MKILIMKESGSVENHLAKGLRKRTRQGEALFDRQNLPLFLINLEWQSKYCNSVAFKRPIHGYNQAYHSSVRKFRGNPPSRKGVMVL
ncbi:MAG: hypothetical protein NPIRA06_07900 [Nitrospirales bacterium]|nr:MAG: hypothetical protein NPIRA06_07900 [Nitrospirales bacterium]